jgi:hypothetical protein
MTPLGMVRRVLADLVAIWRSADPATARAYTRAVMRKALEVACTRSLVPADREVAGRTCEFVVLGRRIILEGRCFSGARELYCRKVYFALPGFSIREGDTVVDLGANVGLFTVLAAKIARRVVAIEAQSEFISEIQGLLYMAS